MGAILLLLFDNYNLYELILSISIVQFGFNFAECFARGFDKFAVIIKKGGLDLFLIRPRSIIYRFLEAI